MNNINHAEMARTLAKPKPVPAKDPVNPSHYKNTDNGIECIEAIRAAVGREKFIGFLQGQVIKYNWRLGKKDSALIDSEKAQWYQKKLTEVLQETEKS